MNRAGTHDITGNMSTGFEDDDITPKPLVSFIAFLDERDLDLYSTVRPGDMYEIRNVRVEMLMNDYMTVPQRQVKALLNPKPNRKSNPATAGEDQ
jgi:hypothetical protein